MLALACSVLPARASSDRPALEGECFRLLGRVCSGTRPPNLSRTIIRKNAPRVTLKSMMSRIPVSSKTATLALFACALAPLSLAQVSFTPLTYRTTPASNVVVADFNGDGHADVAVLETSADATSAGSVYLGKGDGTFQPPLPFGSPHADLLVVGDFNGDGHADLALGSFMTGMIGILLGNSDGTFQPAASVPGTPGLTAMCAGDWNRDHKTDLALLDRDSSNLVILLSRGDGEFDTTPVLPVSNNSVNACLAADFNADGKQDIAVISGILLGPSSQGFLTVFLGKGDGTFGALPSKAIANGASAPAAGDFNQDGRTDLAISGFGSFPFFNGELQVLEGAGDGTFSSVFSTPDPFMSIGQQYGSLAVADFSGDGKPDLVSSVSTGLGFLAGNGDGTFQNVVFLTKTADGGPAVADFNGDGKPDVATTDTIYLNTTPATGAHIDQNGVVNAASWETPALSPGALISIYGSGLTLVQGTPPTGASSKVLNGTEIEIDKLPVPLLFVAPGQVNAQVPWELAGAKDAELSISVSGVPGQTFEESVFPYTPGIFVLDAAGHGAVLIATPGVVIAAPAGSFPGARPVNRGEYIQIFATGFGAVSNQPGSGEAAPFDTLAETTAQPSVDLGGVAATVTFSGLSPGSIGVYQMNALVPQDAPVGDAVPLKATIAGVASNTVLIAVR